MNTHKKTLRKNEGVVLLIAILVSSAALAIGIGVYNRTYKELAISSFWKQAQVAFSAADSGLECALYWQIHPSTPALCFGQTVSGGSWTPPGAGSFSADIVSGVGPCVNVVIAYDATLFATTTTARGYNVSCATLAAGTNARIVERGLKVSLQ